MSDSAPADPRRCAADIIDRVLRQRRPLDEVLAIYRALAQLDADDLRLTRALTSGVLRHLGVIDALIRGALSAGWPDHRPRAVTAMRLGVLQLKFMRVADHAAVDTSVALVPPAQRGLVNAVLRRVARDPDSLEGFDQERVSLPEWLWDALLGVYGKATCRAIARAHLAEPPLDLTIKDGDAACWAAQLPGLALATGTVRVKVAGAVTELPGYDDGAWWVQDEAAALPARLLPVPAGGRVFDLCAAPGGKTAQLAARGLRVTAYDQSKARLTRLRANLKRLGLKAEIRQGDAGEIQPSTPPDAILLDAPCSSTGTIRRHPDVPWLKQPADIAALIDTQDRLLDHAATILPPGAVLLYCTCSLLPAEGEDRIAALLARRLELAIDPIDPTELADLTAALRADGTVRLLPHHRAEQGGIDGFYIARLRRRSDG